MHTEDERFAVSNQAIGFGYLSSPFPQRLYLGAMQNEAGFERFVDMATKDYRRLYGSQPAGLTGSPFTRTSKCKCGPVQ